MPCVKRLYFKISLRTTKSVSAAIAFKDLKRGQRARVTSIAPESHERLMEMGLTVGTEFAVEKIAPLGDTVEIRLRGYSLCMRLREAAPVQVVLLPTAP